MDGIRVVLSLRELQRAFCESVTGAPSPELLSLITGGVIPPDARLQIYRNNVLFGLSERLKEGFPVVRELVGAEFFDYAAHTFIEGYLPSEACLAVYGAQFPAFLASLPAASQLSYLPYVARLEWAISQVVRATPGGCLSISALSDRQEDPALLRFSVCPTVQYLASPFRIDQIWMAHHEAGTQGSWHIEQGEAWLEVRSNGALHLTTLRKPIWTFRSELARGETLGSAATLALEIAPDFDISFAINSIFEEGLVVAVGDRTDE
jgi:hypothetical protein